MPRLPEHSHLVPEGGDLGGRWLLDVQFLDCHSAVPVAPEHSPEGAGPYPVSLEYLVHGYFPVLHGLPLVPPVPLDLLLAAWLLLFFCFIFLFFIFVTNLLILIGSLF